MLGEAAVLNVASQEEGDVSTSASGSNTPPSMPKLHGIAFAFMVVPAEPFCALEGSVACAGETRTLIEHVFLQQDIVAGQNVEKAWRSRGFIKASTRKTAIIVRLFVIKSSDSKFRVFFQKSCICALKFRFHFLT